MSGINVSGATSTSHRTRVQTPTSWPKVPPGEVGAAVRRYRSPASMKEASAHVTRGLGAVQRVDPGVDILA